MKQFFTAIVLCASISGCTSTYDSIGSPFGTQAGASGLYEGFQAMKRADYQTAEVLFANVLADNPNDPHANLNMGFVMQETNRPDLARQYYQAAIVNGENRYSNEVYESSNGTSTIVPIVANESVADYARANLEAL